MSPATLPVSYTSVSLMVLTFPELGSATTLSSLTLATFAGDAQAEVNARIAKHVSLPLATDIPVLQAITTDMAIYRIVTRRAIPVPMARAQEWIDRYKEAVEFLNQIASGEISLVDSAGVVVAGRTDIAETWSTTKGFIPTFHEGPWGTHVQDEDKIEEELDKRDLGGIRDRLL